jgi:hypothetical protein
MAERRIGMTRSTLRRGIAPLGLAVALALSVATSGIAAPFAMAAASLKAAASRDVIDLRWRGHGRGGWVAGGVAAGLALGALAASRTYYYPAPYYDAAPYYAPPPAVVYEPAPVYIEPDPGPSYYDYGYDTNDTGPVRQRQLNGTDY